MRKIKVAILAETFPNYREVPVLNQVCGLIDHPDIDIVKIYSTNKLTEHLQEKFKEYELEKITSYISGSPIQKYKSIGLSRLYLIFHAMPRIVLSIFKEPLFVFKTLNGFKYGELVRSFWLYYFSTNYRKVAVEADVILCQFAPWGRVGVALRELGLTQAKIVTTFRGYGIYVTPKVKGKSYYNLLIDKGDNYTANTEATKLSAIAVGFPEDKIFIVHSSLDVHSFPFGTRRFNQKTDTLKILSVGTLKPFKGHKYAIEAMKIVKDQKPNIKLKYYIAGDGPDREILQNLIDELNLGENIELIGFITQKKLKELYTDSHIFLFPSIVADDNSREAQGLVLQEAQATGMPVIATDLDCMMEGMVVNESGFIVKQRDSKDISTKIIDLLDSIERWPEMGKIGRDFVKNNFNVETQTNVLVQKFKMLVENNE